MSVDLGNVERLSLLPGDILTITTDNPLSWAEIQDMKRACRAAVGDVPVMVLTDGIRLGVLDTSTATDIGTPIYDAMVAEYAAADALPPLRDH